MNNIPNIRRYKYYISVNGGSEYELDYAPDGFLDQFILRRHETFKGMFRLYADKTVKFAKDGYDFLVDALNTLGINAEVSLRVARLENWVYVDIFNGSLDVSTMKRTEDYIEFQLLEDENITKLINRKGTKINLNSVTTLDGGALSANEDTLTLTEQQFPLQAQWSLSETTYTVPNVYILPFSLVLTEFSEGQTPDTAGAYPDTTIFKSAVIDYTLATGTGGLNIFCTINFEPITDPPYECTLQIKVKNASGIIQEQHDEIFNTSWPVNTMSFSHLLEDVAVGYSIEVSVLVPVGISNFKINSGTFQLSGAGTLYSEIDVKAVGIYDAFKRAVSILSGLDFDSTLLATSGGNLAAITNGINIRGGEKAVSISLEDLFKCAETCYNGLLGYDGGKIRIENTDYWFEDSDGLDLTDRVTDGDIEIEFDDKFFNSVDVGFAKYLLEYENGLTEFNTKTVYASIINYEKNKTILSNVRADTTGILKLRATPLVTDPVETIEGDDDLFIISAHQVTGSEHAREYEVKTDEGYDVAPSGWYNLDFAPARIIRKHYLREYIGASNLTMEYKEKLTSVVSQETGGELIDENADINFDSFPSKKFIPEVLTVNTYLSHNEVDNLEYKKRIKLTENIKGYLLQLEYNYKDNNSVTLKLIRAYDN